MKQCLRITIAEEVDTIRLYGDILAAVAALAVAVDVTEAHVNVTHAGALMEKSVAIDVRTQVLFNIVSATAKVFILAPQLCVMDAKAQVRFYVEDVKEQVNSIVEDVGGQDI